MLYFVNDYSEGAHEKILQHLIDTNMEQLAGYGMELPQKDGKICAADLRKLAERFYGDENHEHMVFPGMVYISHPTEYGTLYSRKELEELSAV